jgi:hypothetical protein
MILLLAVLAGLLAGMMRAWWAGREYQVPNLRHIWLVFLAVVPQLFAFYLPITPKWIPERLTSGILIVSQLVLLIFVWINRRQPGLWMLGLGLTLNLLVISLNGGWMPISPQVVAKVAPHTPVEVWQTGDRLWNSKDKVLPIEDTRLWWLSDLFVFLSWSSYRVAFSLGDILIAGGVLWLLWAQGGAHSQNFLIQQGIIEG